MEVPGVVAAATFAAGRSDRAVCAGAAQGLERLKKLFAGRLGRILHFHPEQVDQGVWLVLDGYQIRALFHLRCVPVVRSLISIPAGAIRWACPCFLLLTALGSAVWNTVLAWLARCWARPGRGRYPT